MTSEEGRDLVGGLMPFRGQEVDHPLSALLAKPLLDRASE
jgi:hypothetical protein